MIAKPDVPILQASHSAASALVLGYVPYGDNGLAPIRNVVNGSTGSFVGAYATVPWTRGVAINFVTGSYIDWGPSTFLPTSNATVVLLWNKLGAPIQSAAFGTNPDVFPDRFGSHLPWSDGTVYWDFGGVADGVTRLSVPGLTFGDDIFVFTTGPRGMEVWQNGRRVGANSANPTRSPSATTWRTNSGNSAQGDTAYFGGLYLFNRQLTPTEIVGFYSDPFAIIRPRKSPWFMRPPSYSLFRRTLTTRPGSRTAPRSSGGL